VIGYLIENGAAADINLKDRFHRVPLEYAVRGRKVEAAKILLAKGADPAAIDDAKDSMLHLAITKGNVALAGLLLDAGAKPQAEVESAVKTDDPDFLQMFVSKDPSLGTTESLQAAMQTALEHHRVKVVRYLVQSYPALQSIHTAALLGRTAELQKRIASRLDINDGNGAAIATPLHDAVIDGNQEAVNLILASGADINSKDDAGLTPLHYAVIEGEGQIAEILLDKGANVEAADVSGSSPLQWAANSGDLTTCRALIAKHADVNNKADDGCTPLLRAASNGNVDVIKLLADSGADLKATDPDGFTPLQLAQQKGHAEAVAVIRKLLPAKS
jgi:ankyrin repeat protein